MKKRVIVKAQPVMERYSDIRERYNRRLATPSTPASTLSSSHGFFKEDIGKQLTERYAGFDKLFLTMLQNIVLDPDYALMKDHRIYERMKRDPQIYYCLEVRKTATSGLPWDIIPPEGLELDERAKQTAQQAEERLRRVPDFIGLLDNIMEALLPGLSINELVWKVEDGKYFVKQHFPVNKDRFKFDKEGNPRLLQPASPSTGLPVPPYKFLTHSFNVTDGSWKEPSTTGYIYYGKGLADTPLYHYFYFKVTSLRFLLKTMERNANPFKIYYTGPQNAELADKLDEILAALQNDSTVGIPGKKGETNVDVANVVGNPKLFMTFIDYVDRLITRAILGQELMTEMPVVGSYAAAQVHASVFMRIVETDKAAVENTLNKTLLKYDHVLNNPGVPESYMPRFKFKRSRMEDAAYFVDLATKALSLGIDVSEEQVREVTGLRSPRPGETVLDAAKIQAMSSRGNTSSQEENNGSATSGKSSGQEEAVTKILAKRAGKSKENGNGRNS